ncbi:MAG TPA: sugar ABC transporter permease [Candidatus Omnitrophota bacterium]|nr:sugar ABC transporter permease [Candidatus Omnitrophota bacterium]HPS37112.1 sugar ABC transporter permease [Candidatus Omnitrophota bacterium]
MKNGMMKDKTKEMIAAYAFLTPNLLGFLVFTSIPVLVSLGLSFMKWDLLSEKAEFVGLKNFIDLAKDPFFWKYCWNTVYLMAAIPISMAGSLLLALALNQKLKGKLFFRTVYFLPTICSGVAIFMLWRLMYNPNFGFFNVMISNFGDLIGLKLTGPNWLTDEAWAKPAFIIMSVWQSVGGYNMILYLAALQGVPRDLYDAAEVDGATSWQKFWAVTWPQISPTTFFIAIMSLIGGFQAGFDLAYIMTGGGPNGSTMTIIYYIFDNAFNWYHMGYAAAISWVLFLIIFVITLLKWRFYGSSIHYT